MAADGALPAVRELPLPGVDSGPSVAAGAGAGCELLAPMSSGTAAERVACPAAVGPLSLRLTLLTPASPPLATGATLASSARRERPCITRFVSELRPLLDPDAPCTWQVLN